VATINLKDLIAAGLLDVGQQLTWKRRSPRVSEVAVVLRDGRIETRDGAIHKSPSSAASHLSEGMSQNGWRVWKLGLEGPTLHEVRRTLETHVSKVRASE
jgi:hypothetical protein